MIMPRELVRAQRVKAVGTAGQGSAHPRRHFGTILPRAVPTLCLKKPQDIPGPLSRAGNSNTLVFIFGLLRKWKAKMRTPSTIASTLVRPSWRRDSLAVIEGILAPARKTGTRTPGQEGEMRSQCQGQGTQGRSGAHVEGGPSLLHQTIPAAPYHPFMVPSKSTSNVQSVCLGQITDSDAEFQDCMHAHAHRLNLEMRAGRTHPLPWVSLLLISAFPCVLGKIEIRRPNDRMFLCSFQLKSISRSSVGSTSTDLHVEKLLDDGPERAAALLRPQRGRAVRPNHRIPTSVRGSQTEHCDLGRPGRPKSGVAAARMSS